MNSYRIAIDANVAIPIMNRNRESRFLMRGYREICLPVAVLAELHFGALNSHDVAINLERLCRLSSRCVLLIVDEACARCWAELRRELRSLGHPIPKVDLWIAAICIVHDVPLATFDAHFDGIPGLNTVHI